jgi:hypothetical protein
VNVLLIGFPESDLRQLGQLLQQAGHRVLSAPGREGARAFAEALSPDAVVVPEGPRGEEVAAWLDPRTPPLRFVAAPVGPGALALLGGDPPPVEVLPPVEVTTVEVARPWRGEAPPSGNAAGVAPAAAWAGLGSLSAPAGPRSLDDGDHAPPPVELHPELSAKLSQVRLADYFALLEVEPDASTWIIREGHERLARRFSARGWPHRLSPVELEALDEVGRGLADAVLVLGDDDLRARYQRALAAAAQGGSSTVTPGSIGPGGPRTISAAGLATTARTAPPVR